MTPDQTAPVPAGWYPDPYGASELRWWDGQSWTDSVHPSVAASAQSLPEQQSAVTEAVAAEPVAAEPVAPDPVAPEPVAAEPFTPEQAVAGPIAFEPPASEPSAFEPSASEPFAFEPAASEPAAFEPPASEPFAFEPAAFEDSAAPYTAEHAPEPPVTGPPVPQSLPQATVPEFSAPPESAPVTPPLIEPVLASPQSADTILPTVSDIDAVSPPAPEAEAESAPVPAAGLPSRRDLRKRSAGVSEGPLSAHASAPEPPAPESSSPSAFDWMATGTAASATQPASFAPVGPVPQSAAFGQDAPATSGSVPVPASAAWASEPTITSGAVPIVTSPIDPEDLYRSTATRKATVSGWFIAFMPLITGVLAIGAVKGAENYPRYVPAGVKWWMLVGAVIVVLYIVTLILAAADRRKLDWAGYNRPAHWAWALLTAPIYLVVRMVAVKRETGRQSAMLWVWIVLAALLVGAWFAAKYFAPALIDGYTLPFL